MIAFEYIDGELCCEGVKLSVIASDVGTPCYVYSREAIIGRVRTLVGAWPASRTPTLAYGMRVNPSRAILSLLAATEAWVSVTSGAEMMQAMRAGFSPGRMIFSGTERTEEELGLALNKGVHLIVADSRSELDRMARKAMDLGTRARTAIRVHPSAEGPSKVGIPMNLAEKVFRQAADTEGLEVVGLDLFLGRHINDPSRMLEPLAEVVTLMDSLGAAGVMLTMLDIGSSAGQLFDDPGFCTAVAQVVGARPLRIVIEPGRSIVGQAGVLMTRVTNLKESADKHYLLVDGSISDLVAPVLFGSRHPVRPVRQFEPPDAPLFDVVGPQYETSDLLAADLPLAGVVPGDLLSHENAGAFGRILSNNLGMRPRPPEVLVEGDSFRLIRRRETFQDMIRTETDVL